MYIVRENRMRHEGRRNVSETRYFGLFDTEEEADRFAETITGAQVEVCELLTPED